jgi:hypothetical protein
MIPANTFLHRLFNIFSYTICFISDKKARLHFDLPSEIGPNHQAILELIGVQMTTACRDQQENNSLPTKLLTDEFLSPHSSLQRPTEYSSPMNTIDNKQTSGSTDVIIMSENEYPTKNRNPITRKTTPNLPDESLKQGRNIVGCLDSNSYLNSHPHPHPHPRD